MTEELKQVHLCQLCGEPMPAGEEMFKYHGYSGDCPKPPMPRDDCDVTGRPGPLPETGWDEVPTDALRRALTAAQPAQAVEVDELPGMWDHSDLSGGETDAKPEWRDLFWALARELKCLPSTDPGANQHVFRAARAFASLPTQTAAQATPEPVGEARCSTCGVTMNEPHHPACGAVTAAIIGLNTMAAQDKEARRRELAEKIRETLRGVFTHPAPGVPDGVLDAKYFARNGTGFDTCPTRLLPQSEEARKVDEWWLRYFAAADAQVRKHALTMLAAAQAKGVGA